MAAAYIGINHSELKTTLHTIEVHYTIAPSRVLVCSTVLGEIIQVVLGLELGHPMSISLPIAIHPFYLHLLSESMHP